MRILSVKNCVGFNAGKIQLFSDFDGTYCPVKHSSLHQAGNNPQMKEYCSRMDQFFKATEGDLHFHITTGRTFGEYEAISRLLKLKNYHLPLPETFIAKNGSDEYVKLKTKKDFYIDGIFPYKYSKPNGNKEISIMNKTNWNGKELKSFIRDLAEKYQIRLVEADSEHSVRDYGNNSLFSEGKLNKNEWQKLPIKDGKFLVHSKPIADFSVGARNDGNLKINLIFSPDYGYCPKRNYIYDNFVKEIKAFLMQHNTNYHIEWDVPTKENHYRNHCNITPEIEGGALTKLFDTKEALKTAIAENDIVIVAGDGSNDFKMLNPLEYIDKKEWDVYKKKSQNKIFYESDMKNKLLYLRDVYNGKNDSLKQVLEQDGLLRKIDKLPFYGIIVKNKDSDLKLLLETFSKIGKIIEVDNGNLDVGVKKVIRNHAIKKDSFKKSMSDKLKNYIGIVVKKKSYKETVVFTTSAVLATGIGIYFKRRDEVNYENNDVDYDRAKI